MNVALTLNPTPSSFVAPSSTSPTPSPTGAGIVWNIDNNQIAIFTVSVVAFVLIIIFFWRYNAVANNPNYRNDLANLEERYK